MEQTEKSWLTGASLRCGIAVPILYFGIQLVAAPFYPGYSFFSQDASTLGAPESSAPSIFNLGSIVVGVLLLLAIPGLYRACVGRNSRRIVHWVVMATFIAGAVASINAGLHPLPDELHASGLLANIGAVFFALPFVLPFLFHADSRSRSMRIYSWVNLAILFCLFPIVSGLIQRVGGAWDLELTAYQEWLNNSFGAIQRIAAAVLMVPVGVLSWHLLSANIGED